MVPLAVYPPYPLGFGRLGMVWQPDVWAKALRATKLTSFRLCRTKDECESVCSQQPG